MKLLSQRSALTGFALVALMAATRMHHFGDALHLPDASLAVFLLAGILIASPLFFGGLLIEAATLDYVAITHLGVSDFCVTPAYWLLVPAYAVLWFAGRYYASIHQQSWRSLGMFSGTAFAAVSVSFFISNGAFYWFSGRNTNTNMTEYFAQAAQYYAPYLTSSLLYLAFAAALYAALATRVPVAAKQTNT
jgi:hypothetical protein